MVKSMNNCSRLTGWLSWGIVLYIVLGCRAPQTITAADEQQIEKALITQWEQYPESRLQDIYKNFYQDRFGSEHALSTEDTAAMRRYIEYETVHFALAPQPLIEQLGWEHRFLRVNLTAVRDGMISAEELADAFVRSASMTDSVKKSQWVQEWKTIVRLIEKNKLPIPEFDQDRVLIDSLLEEHPQMAIHHSEAFRQKYKPHYRIVAQSVWEELTRKE